MHHIFIFYIVLHRLMEYLEAMLGFDRFILFRICYKSLASVGQEKSAAFIHMKLFCVPETNWQYESFLHT